MIPFCLSIFVLLDGTVTRNPSAWAGPVRALMLAALFSTAWCTLRRCRSTTWSAAVVCGLCAALTCAQAAHDPLGWGLPLMMCYAAAWGWQRIMQREWTNDLACTGLIVAIYIALLELAGTRPDGLLNRNVLAGVVAVCVPSGASLPRRRRWIVTGAMIAAIALSGGRAALLACGLALLIIRGEIHVQTAIIALPVAAALVCLRPATALVRLAIWRESWTALMTSPWFGLSRLNIVIGPETFGHAHNSILSLAVFTGMVGVGLVSLFVATSRRGLIDRWQAATLAAFGVCASVDDAFLWLPVGLIVSIVLATNRVPGTPAPSGAS